jgi:hypothetical protein
MGAIEMDFDAALARETASLALVLYWLESGADVDDLHTAILDEKGITPRESMILVIPYCAGPQLQEAMAHEQAKSRLFHPHLLNSIRSIDAQGWNV